MVKHIINGYCTSQNNPERDRFLTLLVDSFTLDFINSKFFHDKKKISKAAWTKANWDARMYGPGKDKYENWVNVSKVNICHGKFEKKIAKVAAVNVAKENIIQTAKANCGLYFCNVNLCRVSFSSEIWMKKHVDKGLHYYGGCSIFTNIARRHSKNAHLPPQPQKKDLMINFVQDKSAQFASKSIMIKET